MVLTDFQQNVRDDWDLFTEECRYLYFVQNMSLREVARHTGADFQDVADAIFQARSEIYC